MAVTLDDVLSRRTKPGPGPRRHGTAKLAVARLVGGELGWDDDRIRREVDAYTASVVHERHSAGLPETALDAALGA
jgi:glycerol-3-phosphate dehydrogenase